VEEFMPKVYQSTLIIYTLDKKLDDGIYECLIVANVSRRNNVTILNYKINHLIDITPSKK